MKKLILTVLLTLTPMVAKEATKTENPFLHGDNFPKGYFLTSDSMPHFMHLYMKQGGSIQIDDLTPKQEEIIEKKFSQTPPKVMKIAKEIKALETTLVLAVVNDGKNAEDLTETLEKIANKRKELTVLKISCLNMFKETLTKQQYKVLVDMATKEAKQ